MRTYIEKSSGLTIKSKRNDLQYCLLITNVHTKEQYLNFESKNIEHPTRILNQSLGKNPNYIAEVVKLELVK